MTVRTALPRAGLPASADGAAAVPSTSGMPAWEPPASVASGLPAERGARVRLSLRLVVHLSGLGPPADDGAARQESTQEGLSRALGVTQGAVSRVLARLVAVDIVCRERRRVRGVNRRVRAYFLTRQGDALAREIRDRFGLPRREPKNP